jgi:pyridoxine 5'-phosphate synthase PdxJ
MATDSAHQTYKEACLFINQNRAKLPVSGYIDMCRIETHTGCYYITDVQDVDNG